jgi:5-methylcytosine-specific restriction endonuclease McrA
MPYVNKPRPYAKEYQQQKARKEEKKRAARARARYEFDNPGQDGKVINRKGKDIEHIKPLSKGGSSALSNLRLESQHDNRSFYRNSDHTVKRNVSRKKK